MFHAEGKGGVTFAFNVKDLTERLFTVNLSRKFIPMIATSMLILSILAGCGGTTAPSDNSQGGSEKLDIAFVPKLINVSYFNAMQAGANQAAKDLNVNVIYDGPTTADANAQVQIIRQLIARRVDAIAVAPNDPAVVGPVLQQAEAQGIKTFTTDTDAPSSVRDIFVTQALDTEIGSSTIDALANAMGKQGEWAIVSCGPAAQNLNSWIDIEKKRAAEMYPDMKFVTTVYSGEDIAKAVSDTRDLITSHPNLKGIIGQCTTSGPGAAKAVTDMKKIGQVFVTGVALPNDMKPYIENGASKSVYERE